ncbi:MAG: putative unusual protein kinase regulating ubiquinone biosynthesis (AarF/ABC1/UbiB family) [Thermoproteota archaeon]|jgi:predicted unusual protein kinase regulating ubiquinone biosynthesis (AarF/ABC1/UbiB family)
MGRYFLNFQLKLLNSETREDLPEHFYQSFKKTPDDMFEEFSYIPMASASIGQVHKARLKTGEYVAVKI